MDNENQERVILVVDDSSLAPCAVREALVPLGYRVALAVDKTDALNQLANEASISLVLVDMRTPSIVGRDVVRALEESKLGKTAVPIVVLSAEGQPHIIEKAESAGSIAWLVKPFDPKVFGTQPRSQR